MTTYQELVKEIPFQPGVGVYDRCALLDQTFFGWYSLSLRYGLAARPGMLAEETAQQHTHDYDQLLWFLSADPEDAWSLGAELEISLGEENIRHRIAVPTVVVIPKGTPHFSPRVLRLDRRFTFLSVNASGALSASPADPARRPEDGALGGFRSAYKENVMDLKFSANNPYHYGSDSYQGSGGVGTLVTSAMTGLNLTMSWQTVMAPHHVGPRGPGGDYGAHVHGDFDEALLFLGMDPGDPVPLHAQAEYGVGQPGKDQTLYLIEKSSAMVMRKGVYHLPLAFTRVDRPLSFLILGNH